MRSEFSLHPQKQHASQSLRTNSDGGAICGVPKTASLDSGAQHAWFTVLTDIRNFSCQSKEKTGCARLWSRSGSVIIQGRNYLEEEMMN